VCFFLQKPSGFSAKVELQFDIPCDTGKKKATLSDGLF